WTAAKRVLRYLKSTANWKLFFQSGGSNSELHGYCDADWAQNPDDRKSNTGYVFLLSGAGGSWSSKRQPTVATSTTEAEYMSMSSASQEALWLKGFLTELCPSYEDSIVLFCDNKSAISLATSCGFKGRTKHIDVRHHFIRELVSSGEIKIVYVATTDMLA